ncbi:MAG: menaquinol oxidoreductase [Candidatus Latescibacteria bacterium]|nr:menaquinol oxidoreductase [Candidatus Latescibacterota bacterium]NIM22153.1 menaquinol oxidoreductase [Candidatus Latescibacterota bacterium]NIM64703.1 menaquinol oxidoreductase [Candidatus Latescibacterota bacterium]NIO01213.1 menaquinol oxidoreductase [Candidatus Latescibacterota bacterium]NIO27598.1 menaquinol oxidoreductase [Candidatus Latescibacterota bacterium]
MVRRLIIAAVIGLFTLFVAATVLMAYRWHAAHRPPEQPIAFSHRLHAGKLNLQCQFCHEYADKSPRAGVPAVSTCMSCHKAVATNSPEVQKLHEYWENEEPVPWNRVYSLRVRKYVVFAHKRHVKADLDCTDCHGEVRLMDRVRRVSSLNMGWCVTCHRSRSASTDCLTCHK